MIIVKTPEQIKLMRIAGRITGEALLLGGEMVKPAFPQNRSTIKSDIISKSAAQNRPSSDTADSPAQPASR